MFISDFLYYYIILSLENKIMDGLLDVPVGFGCNYVAWTCLFEIDLLTFKIKI